MSTQQSEIKISHPVDVVAFKAELIEKWRPRKQVWPFLYGDDALCVVAGVSSGYFCHFFRKKLKLRHFARYSCYAPGVIMGGFATIIFHEIYVNGLILKQHPCSVCMQVKTAIGQFFVGCVYPVLFCSVMTFYLADKFFTYPLPPLTAPKETFQVWLKLVKPIPKSFFAFSVFQIAAACFITHEKQKTFVDLKMLGSSKD